MFNSDFYLQTIIGLHTFVLHVKESNEDGDVIALLTSERYKGTLCKLGKSDIENKSHYAVSLTWFDVTTRRKTKRSFILSQTNVVEPIKIALFCFIAMHALENIVLPLSIISFKVERYFSDETALFDYNEYKPANKANFYHSTAEDIKAIANIDVWANDFAISSPALEALKKRLKTPILSSSEFFR